jgi:hypothetical protein
MRKPICAVSLPCSYLLSFFRWDAKRSPRSGEQTLPARAEDQNFFFRFVHQGSYGND